MQVKANIEDLLKSFDRVQEEIAARLRYMAVDFAYKITLKAIDTTPIGTMNPSYLIDSRRDYYAPEPGTAKGGWRVSFDEQDWVGSWVIAENKEAKNIKNRAENKLSQFKLGDTISISNDVKYITQEGFTMPQFGSLEGGYSKDAPYGIFEPTFDSIMSVYNHEFKTSYDSYVMP